ncbi:tripartite tricarboxylate transporter substrate binding protein [soil metagenome]
MSRTLEGRRAALTTLATAAAATAAIASPIAAFAQAADAYPNKAIRIIVPFPAGGTSDTLARLIGQKFTEAWGQPVIVDNRAGANGNLGADAVAKAAPDGYTLVLMDCGNLTISPSLYPKLPFNPVTDFAPVTMFAYSPHLLVVSNKLPVKTLPELISYVKANPGKVNYAAAAGTGSAPHLAGVLLAQRAGLDWAYVPYKGGAQALGDMVGGQVDVTLNGMLATYPFVKANNVKLLATASEKRLAQEPNVPTVGESYPGFVTGSWQGILAPANTPKPIIAKLHDQLIKILAMPDIKEKLAGQGADPVGNTPEQFAAWTKTEVTTWAKVVKDGNITVD